jgi:hypothetical protein
LRFTLWGGGQNWGPRRRWETTSGGGVGS